MRTVTCPFCHEKGPIPSSFIGKRVKCGKCENRFLVTPPPAKVAAPAAAATAAEGPPSTQAGASSDNAITIDGLEESSWETPGPGVGAAVSQVETAPSPSDAGQGVFTASHGEHHAEHHGANKAYKLLTQKDKFFEGKFDLPRLEEAINHYSHQGWTVKAMTTAQVLGFSGGLKEELVVLLER
jgi:hypothetical protein